MWVDFCAPSKEQLHELAGGWFPRPAVEDALGPHQRPSSTATPPTCSCPVTPSASTPTVAASKDRDRFVHHASWLITVRKDDDFPIDPCSSVGTVRPTSSPTGWSSCSPDFSMWSSTATSTRCNYSTTTTTTSAKASSPSSRSTLPSSDLVRDAARHGSFPPPRRSRCAKRSAASCGANTRASPKRLYPYYQDVYDHILRVSESTDSLRDLVSTIVETNLSLRDYRQNQVMKKVTSWAAIIAVPTLITGYYGMNVPYPGSQELGRRVSTALMIIFVRRALPALPPARLALERASRERRQLILINAAALRIAHRSAVMIHRARLSRWWERVGPRSFGLTRRSAGPGGCLGSDQSTG